MPLIPNGTEKLNDIKEIDGKITDHKNVLDGNDAYNRCSIFDTNRMILLSAIKFSIDSKSFHLPLF